MADGGSGEKTVQPTERRRKQARENGQVPRSVDVIAAGVLLTVSTLLLVMGPKLSERLAEGVRQTLAGDVWLEFSRENMRAEFRRYFDLLAGTVFTLMGSIALAASLLNLVQFGFLFSTKSLKPQISRVSPLAGFKRIFSMASLVKLGTSLLKLVLVVGLAGWMLWSSLPDLLVLQGHSPIMVAVGVGRLIVRLAFTLSGTLFVIALLDWLYQRHKHEKDLMMTQQELRDEIKQQDGDPHVRQRQKQAHAQLAEGRDLTNVPEASVVVTNPTHFSIAIGYDPKKHAAPVVLARGVDLIALRIRQIAAEHGIPILERPPLARRLYRELKVGEPIPPDLYDAFVEIMAYVYRITGKPIPTM